MITGTANIVVLAVSFLVLSGILNYRSKEAAAILVAAISITGVLGLVSYIIPLYLSAFVKLAESENLSLDEEKGMADTLTCIEQIGWNDTKNKRHGIKQLWAGMKPALFFV